ncbi:hypothetical protein OQJ13_11485 [Legionella sp. PATHC035]|uniref:hypothetical protein n=1 Tax=Legionella sp. PATHC035 TaxID=2992040 RepID=UPI00224456E5|nr:hypothetical protein [Legionella sp. PATHC035]MCW8409592.1 hypothetical protein [Legionella sp. PATHC035]
MFSKRFNGSYLNKDKFKKIDEECKKETDAMIDQCFEDYERNENSAALSICCLERDAMNEMCIKDRVNKEEVKELLDRVESMGDKLGHECIAPATSFIVGEHRLNNAWRLLLNAPKCYGIGKEIEKLSEEDSILSEPKINNALGELFQAAGNTGSCRFWQRGGKELAECKEVTNKQSQARKNAQEEIIHRLSK